MQQSILLAVVIIIVVVIIIISLQNATRGLNFDLTISDVLQLWHVETSATTTATICAANRLVTASCPLLTAFSAQGRRRRCPTAHTASPTIPSSAPRTQSAWPATADLRRQVGGGQQVMPVADVVMLATTSR